MTRLFVSFYLFMAVSLVLISSTLELIWPGEDYRERFLYMLMTPKGGRANATAKDVLRLILYRCRVAKRLRKAPLKEMKGYRWRYIAANDMEIGRAHV